MNIIINGWLCLGTTISWGPWAFKVNHCVLDLLALCIAYKIILWSRTWCYIQNLGVYVIFFLNVNLISTWDYMVATLVFVPVVIPFPKKPHSSMRVWVQSSWSSNICVCEFRLESIWLSIVVTSHVLFSLLIFWSNGLSMCCFSFHIPCNCFISQYVADML